MPRAEGREGRAGLASFGPHAPARAGSRAPHTQRRAGLSTTTSTSCLPAPSTRSALSTAACTVDPSATTSSGRVAGLSLTSATGGGRARSVPASRQGPCGSRRTPEQVKRARKARAQGFRERVYAVVSRIPRGRVLTYGDVAALAGRPRAAREVGWIAHRGPSHLPWQRVVNRHGGLASGYEGGRQAHRRALERDGVQVRPDGTVDLSRYRWTPLQLVRWRAPSKRRRARSGGPGRWPSLR
jgi:methylated-DNA-protein-cysteine methyltransferase-like protein